MVVSGVRNACDIGTTAGGDGEWRRRRVLADWTRRRRTLGLGCQARGSVWPYAAIAGAASRSHMVHCGERFWECDLGAGSLL